MVKFISWSTCGWHSACWCSSLPSTTCFIVHNSHLSHRRQGPTSRRRTLTSVEEGTERIGSGVIQQQQSHKTLSCWYKVKTGSVFSTPGNFNSCSHRRQAHWDILFVSSKLLLGKCPPHNNTQSQKHLYRIKLVYVARLQCGCQNWKEPCLNAEELKFLRPSCVHCSHTECTRQHVLLYSSTL